MKEEEYKSMEPEAKAVYDSVHVMMKLCHYAYETAQKEGFTPIQSLEMAKQYLDSLMGMGGKK